MWVYSISAPTLSLIGSLTTEIYYWTEKNGNKHTQTHTQDIGLSNQSEKALLFFLISPKADLY